MTHEHIVVGAGISGLAFAARLADAGRSVLVLEAASDPGGCISSRPHEDFWLELGAHTAYNSYGGFIALLESSDSISLLTAREKVSFRVWLDHQAQSVMKRLNFLEAAVSVPKMLWTRREDLSVREYYSRILGSGNYEHLLRHAFAAVPSQPADEFPADMLFHSRPRRKDIIRSFTLTGGLQQALHALARLPEIELRTGVQVTSISPEESCFTLSTVAGESMQCQQLTLATPAAVTGPLTEHLSEDLSQALSGVKSVNINSTGVVVRKQNTTLPPLAGLIGLDDRFYSVVSRDIVPHALYRGFTFHFSGQVDEAERMTVIADTLGTSEFEEVFHAYHQLPSPRPGHRDLTDRINLLAADANITLVGNYFEGLAIEDCVQHAFSEAEKVLRG